MCKEIGMDVVSEKPKMTILDTNIFSLEQARTIIANTIGASPEEIFFTKGDTKGSKTAVQAAVACGKVKKHIITTTAEDEAVLSECARLEEDGGEVTRLSPLTTGRVEVAMIESEVRENTCLISVRAANPETGTSQPFTGIGGLAAAHGIFFHLDASYAYGRMPINVDKSKIDILSASTRYLGGPDDVGFLYIRKSTGIGERVAEADADVSKISKMAVGACYAAADVSEYMEGMKKVRSHLCGRIFSEIEGVTLNGHKDHHLVNHLNVRIQNVSAAVVQKSLACSGVRAGIGTGSQTLRAIGCTDAQAAESVRFALAATVTKEEVDFTVDRLKEIVTGQRVI